MRHPWTSQAPTTAAADHSNTHWQPTHTHTHTQAHRHNWLITFIFDNMKQTYISFYCVSMYLIVIFVLLFLLKCFIHKHTLFEAKHKVGFRFLKSEMLYSSLVKMNWKQEDFVKDTLFQFFVFQCYVMHFILIDRFPVYHQTRTRVLLKSHHHHIMIAYIRAFLVIWYTL